MAFTNLIWCLAWMTMKVLSSSRLLWHAKFLQPYSQRKRAKWPRNVTCSSFLSYTDVLTNFHKNCCKFRFAGGRLKTCRTSSAVVRLSTAHSGDRFQMTLLPHVLSRNANSWINTSHASATTDLPRIGKIKALYVDRLTYPRPRWIKHPLTHARSAWESRPTRTPPNGGNSRVYRCSVAHRTFFGWILL